MDGAKKILVVGCPGAGKSTFSIKLGQKTGIKVYHLDLLWHNPDATNVSREEFKERLENVLKEDEWIIDGNYSRTLEMRLSQADKVFFFDLPTEECLEGARSRIGRKRPDFPYIEKEFDSEFETWIKNFAKDELPKLYELLSGHDIETVIFHSRSEADAYLQD